MKDRTKQRHSIFMQMARDIAKLSTCSRRQVGCIIVNKDHIVIGSGYNGRPAGFPHCESQNSDGVKDQCRCVHAEVNAVILAAHTEYGKFRGDKTAYVTTFPCDQGCIQLLAAFGVTEIVYDTEYNYFESSRKMADYYGMTYFKLEGENENAVVVGIPELR